MARYFVLTAAHATLSLPAPNDKQLRRRQATKRVTTPRFEQLSPIRSGWTRGTKAASSLMAPAGAFSLPTDGKGAAMDLLSKRIGDLTPRKCSTWERVERNGGRRSSRDEESVERKSAVVLSRVSVSIGVGDGEGTGDARKPQQQQQPPVGVAAQPRR